MIAGTDRPVMRFADLGRTGVLWLINRVVFHPRGFALALETGELTGETFGWKLLGDGREVIGFHEAHDDESFAAVKEFLDSMTAAPVVQPVASDLAEITRAADDYYRDKPE